MISNIRYYSFKELHLRHRQPFWILILAIIVTQLTIAEPQVMLFSIFSLYMLSGPVRALTRLWGSGTSQDAVPEGGAAPHLQSPRALDSDTESSL